MRVYGRIPDGMGGKTWVVVTTAANGDNTDVHLTALCQDFLLNVNESPFFAQDGIPARQSVQQQIPPDFYVQRIVKRFSPFFANIVAAKQPGTVNPTYNVSVTTLFGAQIAFTITVPQ